MKSSLREKKDYKTPYRQEYIDPEKLFRAIQFLKDQDNPFYQNVRDIRDYNKYCEYQDSNIVREQEKDIVTKASKSIKRCSVLFVSDEDSTWDEIMDLREYLLKLHDIAADDEEMEYRTKDPVRKFQIDYDKSICLSEKFPEAFHLENNKTLGELSVAPGEGKLPENILMSENWDALAYPMKHPDGKYNLHYDQKVVVLHLDQLYGSVWIKRYMQPLSALKSSS